MPSRPQILRMAVRNDNGAFIVYDAVLPPDADRDSAGYVALYFDAPSELTFVYSELLFNVDDIRRALAAVERDFSPRLLIGGEVVPKDARSADGEVSSTPELGSGIWQDAVVGDVARVMGVTTEGVDDPMPNVVCPPHGCTQGAVAFLPRGATHWSVPAPPPPGVPFADWLPHGSVAVDCCGGGGGGTGPCVECCCVFGATESATAAAAVSEPTPNAADCCAPSVDCDDGNACTVNDRCGNPEVQGCTCGTLLGPCCGVPRNCDDADPCTKDSCDPDFGCINTPYCQSTPCCPDGAGHFCCQGGASVCCYNPDHCCEDNQTCCGADCCGAGVPCCGDECCPDDGDPCTDEVCVNGACMHPCTPACTKLCAQGGVTGWCEACACDQAACSLSASTGILICAGDVEHRTIVATCSPDCATMSLTAEMLEPNWQKWLSASVSPPSIVCGELKSTAELTLAASAAAPAGTTFVRIIGIVEFQGTVVCQTVADVEVTVTLPTIAADPRIIPAKTTCPEVWDYGFSELSTIWFPTDCQVELRIDELIGLDGYVPPNQGTILRADSDTWFYASFDEPITQIHARPVDVFLQAYTDGQPLSAVPRVRIEVWPVYKWWTSVHQHGPGAPVHPPTVEDFEVVYNYIRCKYSGLLNSVQGADFSSVTFTTDPSVPCGFPSKQVAACTEIDDDVVFSAQVFSGTENAAVSTVGHELVHTVGFLNQSECTAYTWEVDHQQETGIDQDETYLDDVTMKQAEECN